MLIQDSTKKMDMSKIGKNTFFITYQQKKKEKKRRKEHFLYERGPFWLAIVQLGLNIQKK